MFRLIPLRSLVRSAKHSVDEMFPVNFENVVSIHRDIIAPNSTSPGYELPREWNMMPDRSNTVLITQGALELTIYSLQKRTESSLILTPENVHLNGKIHYGSPAMIEWSPGIFYKMRAKSEGCAFVTFTTNSILANEEVESLAAYAI